MSEFEFVQRLLVDRDAGLLAWIITHPRGDGEPWGAYVKRALTAGKSQP